jgi:hypothetical protein
VIAGQIVSRTGHYRAILLSGPLVLVGGFYLLTRLGVDSSRLELTAALVVVGVGLGLGLGLGMQTYVLVVQKRCPRA